MNSDHAPKNEVRRAGRRRRSRSDAQAPARGSTNVLADCDVLRNYPIILSRPRIGFSSWRMIPPDHVGLGVWGEAPDRYLLMRWRQMVNGLCEALIIRRERECAEESEAFAGNIAAGDPKGLQGCARSSADRSYNLPTSEGDRVARGIAQVRCEAFSCSARRAIHSPLTPRTRCCWAFLVHGFVSFVD